MTDTTSLRDALREIQIVAHAGPEPDTTVESLLAWLRSVVDAPLAARAEPQAGEYLCGGMRFKLHARSYRAAFTDFPAELAGKWVALVDATDNRHMLAAVPSPASRARPEAQGEAWASDDFYSGHPLPKLHDDPAINAEILIQALTARLDTARQALAAAASMQVVQPALQQVKANAAWAMDETDPRRVLPRSATYAAAPSPEARPAAQEWGSWDQYGRWRPSIGEGAPFPAEQWRQNVANGYDTPPADRAPGGEVTEVRIAEVIQEYTGCADSDSVHAAIAVLAELAARTDKGEGR